MPALSRDECEKLIANTRLLARVAEHLKRHQVCLRIVTHHGRSATQLAAPNLQAKDLHPPIQAQAPVIAHHVSVPDQPNFARPPTPVLCKNKSARIECVRRDVIHMQAYAPRNRNKRQNAPNQQIAPLSLPDSLYYRISQDCFICASGLVLRFQDGSSAKAPLRRLTEEAPRLDG
ncbi:hypothetical protein CC77DRAFT_1069424 [Alternaria alternata]|uniref:Uncharacterized protein n=1 Tax=Alternaria alternata TaxID=5599 RepID=A0A177E538_ALTAL|nr:hypothetical protein CC77DRAFT_1069424 [Alternaria alternata]XP_051586896.1 uncharacterized protein J4E82_007045 [Alternaria postmessia]KAH6852049.1 hypothetical protein B0T12DRAFT_473389 [Alternaria alternata]KAI5374193.1 hypothetical protein J4E82_007045 [Alternaria postmessia]OAG26332.1 hypothetical protein CC77DRAFT_1069424 [Alternaria alternata]